MDIIFLLIPVSFVLIAGAIYLFFWAVKDGQFDDLDGSAHSILFDDDKPTPKPDTKLKSKSEAEKNGKEVDTVKSEKKTQEPPTEGESS